MTPVLLTFSGSGVALAADPASILVIDDRLEENSVVTDADLSRRQATDLNDVFSGDPSVKVGGGVAIGQKLYVRGIEDTNLNVTIDGARQGGYLFHHTGRLSTDPALLKRAEVDSGPATADAGPGALGGSVRFVTKDAQDMLAPDQRLGARISAGTESAYNAVTGGTAVYGRAGEHLGILGYVSARNSDDYTDGHGHEQPRTEGQQRAYLLKLSLLEAGDHDLRLSAERRTDHGTYLTRPHMPLFSRQAPTYQEMNRDTYTLNYDWHPLTNWLDLSTTLYHTTIDHERDGGSRARARDIGGDVRNRMLFETGAIDHELTTGVDYFEEETDNRSNGASTGPNSDDTARNLGLYVQDRMTWGRVGLSTGARLDRFDTDYGQAGTVDGSELSPNITLSLQATDALRLHAGYAEAIRGAKTREVLLNGDAIAIESGLEPEKARQREIGLEWFEQSVLTAGDRLSITLTGFHTDIEHLQAYNRRATTATLYNLDGTVESRGVEASIGWGVGRYDTRLSYTTVDLEDADGKPLGDAMAIGASTGDSWVWDHEYRLEHVTLGYTLNAVERLSDVADGDTEKPGYVTHDLRAQWRPAAYSGLTLTLAVNNVFDKAYFDQTTFALEGNSAVYEPGRDVRLGMSYAF
nr:TonB-dependent receptor [Larsenimonas salina]